MIRRIKLMLLYMDGKYVGQAVDATAPVPPVSPIDVPVCIHSIELAIEETPPRVVDWATDPFRKQAK